MLVMLVLAGADFCIRATSMKRHAHDQAGSEDETKDAEAIR